MGTSLCGAVRAYSSVCSTLFRSAVSYFAVFDWRSVCVILNSCLSSCLSWVCELTQVNFARWAAAEEKVSTLESKDFRWFRSVCFCLRLKIEHLNIGIDLGSASSQLIALHCKSDVCLHVSFFPLALFACLWKSLESLKKISKEAALKTIRKARPAVIRRLFSFSVII